MKTVNPKVQEAQLIPNTRNMKKAIPMESSHNLHRKIFNHKFNVFIRFRANQIIDFSLNELL